MNKEEFLEYFCYDGYPSTFENNKNAMNIKLYWKISKTLDEDARYFWDNLYLESNGIDIRTSFLFDRDEEENIKIMNYLEKNSHKIQEKITDKIVWENKSGKERKVVRISNQELRYEKQSDWNEINNWCIKNSYLLKEFAEAVLLGYNG